MRISIIIPTLNEEKLIAALIRQLRAVAAGKIYEIIIADGGSTDKTREIAAKENVKVVVCRSRGRAGQMNEGADTATGEIFYFLHADTLPPAGFDQLIKNALLGGAGAGCFRLKFSGNHPVLRFYGWCTQFNSIFFRYGDQSLFVKCEHFRKAGGYDEDLAVMEDQEIVRRLKRITPFKVLHQSVKTSARKYEKNGVFKLQLIYLAIFILYYFGTRQDTLTHLYNTLINRVE